MQTVSWKYVGIFFSSKGNKTQKKTKQMENIAMRYNKTKINKLCYIINKP
jgi:hypothetical protein